MAWEMGGGGGTERFLIVAASEPLREFEKELDRLPIPGAGATARALDEPAAAGLYRGVARMAEIPAAAGNGDAASGEALFELARRLEAAPRSTTWIREIALRNP